jgi:hypothetical protein
VIFDVWKKSFAQWRELQKNNELAALTTRIRELLDRCPHTIILIRHAHTTPSMFGKDYGYDYLKVWAKCSDCDEEWLLQGRTDGYFSKSSNREVYKDAIRHVNSRD